MALSFQWGFRRTGKFLRGFGVFLGVFPKLLQVLRFLYGCFSQERDGNISSLMFFAWFWAFPMSFPTGFEFLNGFANVFFPSVLNLFHLAKWFPAFFRLSG